VVMSGLSVCCSTSHRLRSVDSSATSAMYTRSQS
jgi:hypothetical protein